MLCGYHKQKKGDTRTLLDMTHTFITYIVEISNMNYIHKYKFSKLYLLIMCRIFVYLNKTVGNK
jgi:hypothetical protein